MSVLDDAPTSRSSYPVLWNVDTRWSDNDLFGHLNNAVYYQLFDSAVNGWLAAESGLAPGAVAAQGVVVESGCRFLASVAFPQPLVVGLDVARLGRSSVTYRLALFRRDVADAPAAAVAYWVHVYVDPSTRRPVPVPEPLRRPMAALAQSALPSSPART